MEKEYELLQKVIKDGGYKVVEDDGEHIVIRYLLNNMYVVPSENNDHFVSIILPNFADVTEDNFKEVIIKCNRVNAQMKQAKLFTSKNILIATAEFYYMEEKDLAYQMSIALDSIVAAKVNYKSYRR